MERLTITLPEDLVAQAHADVAAGSARSVSAWITDRLRGTAPPSLAAAEVFDEFLSEIERRNSGRPSWDSEKRAARQMLDQLYAEHEAANRTAA